MLRKPMPTGCLFAVGVKYKNMLIYINCYSWQEMSDENKNTIFFEKSSKKVLTFRMLWCIVNIAVADDNTAGNGVGA